VVRARRRAVAEGIVVLVLCGATLVIYTALTRDWSVWRRLYLLPGLALLLAIVSGWFVLVAQRNPGFLEFFFVHEHLERFLTTIHHRVEPWWYFLPLTAARNRAMAGSAAAGCAGQCLDACGNDRIQASRVRIAVVLRS
jgi:hypothetical protein